MPKVTDNSFENSIESISDVECFSSSMLRRWCFAFHNVLLWCIRNYCQWFWKIRWRWWWFLTAVLFRAMNCEDIQLWINSTGERFERFFRLRPLSACKTSFMRYTLCVSSYWNLFEFNLVDVSLINKRVTVLRSSSVLKCLTRLSKLCQFDEN